MHEDDVADAINLALFNLSCGALNLAAIGEYNIKEVITGRYRHAIAVPFRGVKNTLNIAWCLTGYGGEPAWLDGMRHTLTLDCVRAYSELAWRPKFTATEALAAVK